MDCLGDEGGVYVEGVRVNIHEDGGGALVEDDVGGGDEGEGGGDDQVALSYASGDDAEV